MRGLRVDYTADPADVQPSPTWFTPRHRLWMGMTVCLAGIALGVLSILLLEVNKATLQAHPEIQLAPGLLGNGLPYLILGALIVALRPGNGIGWLIGGAGMAGIVAYFLRLYAVYALVTQPGTVPLGAEASWVYQWLWRIPVDFYPLFILLFPTGKAPSPRWRWAVGLDVAIMVAISLPVALLLWPTRGTAILGTDYPGRSEFFALFGGLTPIGLGVSLVATIARYRSARSLERAQIRWIVYAAVLYGIVTTLSGAALSDSPLPDDFTSLVSPAILAFFFLPIGIGIAIFRYHLFDIDRLINRTLIYATLTGSVLAVYMLVVTYLSPLFQVENNRLISLVATGLVAVVFQPLRQRLQLAVNRLMYGKRDDPYAVLSQLGRRLEQTLVPDAVLPTIVETVARTLRLPYVAILLDRPDDAHGAVAAAYPPAYTAEPPSRLVRLPLSYQSEPLGGLVFEPRAPDEALGNTDLRLLDDLARQAGVAVHAVQLTADLQQAHERLVAAREEERRRLRRDLHDGLGSQLAALQMQAGGMKRLIRLDPAVAEELAGELQSELRAAIASIRRLVRNLRPTSLDELGLPAALHERAAQYSVGGERANELAAGEASALRVRVETPDTVPPLAAAVEVAIYRIVEEALTNVARHAHARTCVVRLQIGQTVELEIADDGVGLAAGMRAGVGLLSMRERAAELGGGCQVVRGADTGTRVMVQLPLVEANT